MTHPSKTTPSSSRTTLNGTGISFQGQRQSLGMNLPQTSTFEIRNIPQGMSLRERTSRILEEALRLIEDEDFSEFEDSDSMKQS